jgi:hypothetical protein
MPNFIQDILKAGSLEELIHISFNAGSETIKEIDKLATQLTKLIETEAKNYFGTEKDLKGTGEKILRI